MGKHREVRANANSVIHQLAEDFDILPDEVLAVLAYYNRHRQCIEARITANTAPAV